MMNSGRFSRHSRSESPFRSAIVSSQDATHVPIVRSQKTPPTGSNSIPPTRIDSGHSHEGQLGFLLRESPTASSRTGMQASPMRSRLSGSRRSTSTPDGVSLFPPTRTDSGHSYEGQLGFSTMRIPRRTLPHRGTSSYSELLTLGSPMSPLAFVRAARTLFHTVEGSRTLLRETGRTHTMRVSTRSTHTG